MKPDNIKHNDWLLIKTAEATGKDFEVVKKIVHHSFSQMSKAFGDSETSTIEWVGIGKFVLSEKICFNYLKKALSKIYHGEKKLKEGIDNPQRMIKSIKEEREKYNVLITKLKNNELLSDIRRLEEQFNFKREVVRGDKECGSREDGDL